MKQIEPKTQEQNKVKQDVDFFDARAVSEAEQVIPNEVNRSDGATNQPLVTIQNPRRNFKPLIFGSILLVLLAVGGAAIFQTSSVNADINDEADILAAETPEAANAAADAPEIVSETTPETIVVEKKVPVSAPQPVYQKLPRKTVKEQKFKKKSSSYKKLEKQMKKQLKKSKRKKRKD